MDPACEPDLGLADIEPRLRKLVASGLHVQRRQRQMRIVWRHSSAELAEDPRSTTTILTDPARDDEGVRRGITEDLIAAVLQGESPRAQREVRSKSTVIRPAVQQHDVIPLGRSSAGRRRRASCVVDESGAALRHHGVALRERTARAPPRALSSAPACSPPAACCMRDAEPRLSAEVWTVRLLG